MLLRVAMLMTLAGCSGDPEPEAQLDTMPVTVFVTRDEQPIAVERRVSRRADVLTASLELLLQGPTPEERAASGSF